MATRGRAMPQCCCSASIVTRVTATMRSTVIMSSMRRSEACTVIGTTRRSGLASIITGRGAPVSAARNSVWPGWAKPVP